MADLQTVRSALLGAAQGISGGGWSASSGRCLQGYVPFTRSTGSGFWSACKSGATASGALVIVSPGACVDSDSENGNRHPVFSCEVDVYCAVDKDAASNLSGVVTFIETIRAALLAVISSGSCVYQAPEMIYAGDGILLHYSLECESTGCG